MAGVEAVRRGVPSFGPAVWRKHVLCGARLRAPAVTVICAPTGHGKSVLAAQLVESSAADEVVWIPLYDSDVHDDEWLHRVADALVPDCDRGAGLPDASPQLGSVSASGNASLRFRETLRPYAGRTVDLLLDGADRVQSLEPLMSMARLLRKCTAASSRVILTCRTLLSDECTPDPSEVWAIGTGELLFDDAEVRELLMLSDGEEPETGRVPYLIERFCGHPALTSLMIRHGRMDDSIDPPQDLIWYTRRLAERLGPATLDAAYAVALMREGVASELDDCLRSAGADSADWSTLECLAPLLKTSSCHISSKVRFGLHAALCDVLIAQATTRLSPESSHSIRKAVLSHVTGRGDWSKAAGILTAACTEAEVLEWCETHGMTLLYQRGAHTVERCLACVSPMVIASSAKILLLRSAALREREHLDEALTHAVLAQRLAEADGDFVTQSSAVLFEVRLALFVDDPLRARRSVRQLAGSLGASLGHPARCVLESQVAWLDAQAGDFVAAQEHLEAARSGLSDLDKTHEEAAWTAHTIAGVYGVTMGLWSDAARLLLSAASWAGASPLQALQCRANAAFALLELGSIREVEVVLREIVQATTDANLSVLRVYALTTLAEVRWLSDVTESRDLWDAVCRPLTEWQDSLGLAMMHSAQSMLLRTVGLAEEALAHAEAAVAQLHEHGCSVLLLRILAETEVAASMLALGDQWGARRVALRVESELDGSAANAHLLAVEMVLAEIDRLGGDSEAARARLATFADYIATGSANWRMAMYIRGFPGLLGVAVQAFGAEGLPLRMLHLIPEDVIKSASAQCGTMISPCEQQVLLARACGGESAISSSKSESPQPCRVRFFGGFEVMINGQRVEDTCWRKRKVRLLFAMLAAQRGQDVPRDVILERLWPGMDEERARRNFYVTWSGMKRALGSVSAGASVAEYAVCTTGVCRVTSAVVSDLDEFERAVAVIRSANSEGRPEEALASARRLVEIYRGDLLPGDVYEEWFATLRDQVKHDFCDAMLIGAQCAEAGKDAAEAIVFLRRAGAIDPWREDIYQAMMRCQIDSGQRSRAIETYMTCRGRLVDDLGIDPSAETTRLYQAVLAMEPDAFERSEVV